MVGLDIGSKSIKIVELERRGSGFSLLGSGIVNYNFLGLDSLEDETELSNLSQVIKKLHKDAGISSKDVGLSLPEASVFTRTIRFPLLTDQEVTSAIKWEADQYIPIPSSEAEISWKIVERDDKSGNPGVMVLLIAAPSKLAEKYVHVANNAGLNVAFIETELVSLTRSLAPIDQTVVIIDFGSKSTDIAVVKNKNLLFSRSIPTAGDAFTRAISQNMGIDPFQAEEYKKTYGFSENLLEGKIKMTLEPVLRVIADEIKKAIHYYQSEEKGGLPRNVIVSGGSSILPNLIYLLSKELGTEVLVGDPFLNVSVKDKVRQELANYIPFYSIAAGLAMREG